LLGLLSLLFIYLLVIIARFVVVVAYVSIATINLLT